MSFRKNSTEKQSKSEYKLKKRQKRVEEEREQAHQLAAAELLVETSEQVKEQESQTEHL